MLGRYDSGVEGEGDIWDNIYIMYNLLLLKKVFTINSMVRINSIRSN